MYSLTLVVRKNSYGGTLLLLLILHCASCEITSQEMDSIRALYNTTLANYNKNIRPRLNQSDAVSVNVEFVPSSIISFDSTEQTLVILMHFIISWYDDLLKWDSKDYYGTDSLVMTAKQIWYPHLTYYEASNGDGTIGNADKDMFTVLDTGFVTWVPLQSLRTSCDVSVKYYPFDKQICRIQFDEVVFTNTKVTLNTLAEVPIRQTRPNSEWDLLSVSISKEAHYQSDVIIIDVHLQRRYTLAMYTLIAPLSIMGLLNVCLFLIPISSGEKCSVAITLFLSHGVLMVVTSDMMPANALEISLLVQYEFVLLLLSGFTVIFCIIESRIKASYGDRCFRRPELQFRRSVKQVKVQPQEEVKPGTDDESMPERQSAVVTVPDILTRLDIAVFVVGMLAGVIYSVVLFVRLSNN